MVPAIKATSAESSDHPNPGACRPLNVETRPTIPAMRNSHPRKTVATMPAMNGKMIAASPSRIKTIPSPRYRPQWSCIDLVRAADTLELADDCVGDMARSFVPDVILVLLLIRVASALLRFFTLGGFPMPSKPRNRPAGMLSSGLQPLDTSEPYIRD